MIFRIKRFDPDADVRPSWRSFTVDIQPKMSVLDGLFWILEHLDGTLAFRYSCRAGMCGSCRPQIINISPLISPVRARLSSPPRPRLPLWMSVA